MNKIISVLLFLCFVFGFCGCRQKTKVGLDNEPVLTSLADSSSVYLYYFHGKQRCPTCNAIEEIAKETVEKLYREQKNVRFFSIDREEKENRLIVEKYNIISNALIVRKGTDYTDLTCEAFNYALRKPDKVTSLLRLEIDKRLNKQ